MLIYIVITIYLCYNKMWISMSLKPKEVVALEKKSKVPMEHFNIGEFNRGQSSKLIRGLSMITIKLILPYCPWKS